MSNSRAIVLSVLIIGVIFFLPMPFFYGNYINYTRDCTVITCSRDSIIFDNGCIVKGKCPVALTKLPYHTRCHECKIEPSWWISLYLPYMIIACCVLMAAIPFIAIVHILYKRYKSKNADVGDLEGTYDDDGDLEDLKGTYDVEGKDIKYEMVSSPEIYPAYVPTYTSLPVYSQRTAYYPPSYPLPSYPPPSYSPPSYPPPYQQLYTVM